MSRALAIAAIFFVLVLLLLAGIYPISTEIALARYPVRYWIRVYLEMAGLVTLMTLTVSFIVCRVGRLHRLMRSLVAAVATFLLLAIYGLAVGALSPELHASLPFGNANAKFLGEFMAIKFAFVVSPVVAVLAALITFAGWIPKVRN